MTARATDATFWSNTARKYAASPIRDMAGYQKTLARTRSYLKATDTVLELGCGTGSTALLLAPNVSHIIASDLAQGMIEIAQEKVQQGGAQNVTFKVADVVDHAPCEGPFNAVLAHNLLHLVEDLDGALSRISEFLEPGGVFASKTVCAPAQLGLKYWCLSKLAIPVMQAFGKAPFVQFLTAQSLQTKMIDAGFEIVETSDQTGLLPSQYIVARKR